MTRMLENKLLLLLMLSCLYACTVPAEDDRLYKGPFKSLRILDETGKVDEYIARYDLEGLYGMSRNEVDYYFEKDLDGKIASIVKLPDSSRSVLKYNTSGFMTGVFHADGSSETWDMDGYGKWKQYVFAVSAYGQAYYQELRKNNWEGETVKSQIINRAGGLSEERYFEYGNEVNPLAYFFKENFPIPLGFDICEFSEKMPMQAYNLKEDVNYRYSYQNDVQNRLSEFIIEKQEGEAEWQLFKSYTITYFE